jgi:hypothetical protein
MNFTFEDMERMITEYNEKALRPIRKERGEERADPKDALSNARAMSPDGSWQGPWGEIKDCVKRLEPLYYKRPKELTKKEIRYITNAINDGLNWYFIMAILFVQSLPCDNCEDEKNPAKEDLEEKLKETSV